jgi:ESCRT-I complex subunit VPS28
MDKLRLNIRANDELQPDIRDLYDVMNRLNLIPPDFEGKSRVQKWLHKFQSMNASQEIDESESRDLLLGNKLNS